MSFTIDGNTRLNKVLDLDPKVVDYVVSLRPHDFHRLRNPMMRRLMSPRISLTRVAAMAEVPLAELLQHIAALGQVTVGDTVVQALPQSSSIRPDWIPTNEANIEQEVDLLPIDETLDTDPMRLVAPAIKALPPNDILRVRHKWEPQPFYDVWSKMGNIVWFAEQKSDDEWWIWVRKE